MGRNRHKDVKKGKHSRDDRKERSHTSEGSDGSDDYSLQELKIRARNEEFNKIKHNYDYREKNRSHSNHSRDDRHDYHRNDGHKRLKSDHKLDFKVKDEPMSDCDQKSHKFNNNNNNRNNDQKCEFWSKEAKEMTKDNKVPEKAKPNFELTGKLAEDTNTFNGVVIKYNEPLEARKPKRKWRLYPFKGEEGLPFIPIHRQSAYLLGRDRKVADIPIDHPSCSKQHSVIQFRLVEYQREDTSVGKRVRPYVIDLESSNGTFVNNQKIDAKRYYELFEKDVIKFGFSTREYVLLHEESKNETEDDDIDPNEEQTLVKTEDIKN